MLTLPPCVAKQANILLICVDDLRPELGCYGVEYLRSPHIDNLAAEGLRFEHHYVQAPTCGASRYALLTGCYGGADNMALFDRARRLRDGQPVPPSMPSWFRFHGYTTVSVGKVSHHPGGWGGPDWNDLSQPEMPDSWDRQLLPAGPWQHPRGWMHGLANGEIRGDARLMDVFQAVDGPDTIYPDGISIEEALRQIEMLSGHSRPFFLAVGILRPHLPFGAPARYIEPYREIDLPPIAHPERPTWRTTWHGSGEFMKYNRWGRDPNADDQFADEVRRHYAACVSYADAQVGKLISRLRELGQWENTIVVLWGDHGWHLGEHAVWGKHTLFEESLRSPLIVCSPGLRSQGRTVAEVVESVDIFPTLCELAGLPIPAEVDGASLVPIFHDLSVPDDQAISYFRKARSVRDARFRLIEHDDGYIELYDHQSAAGETRNVAAEYPDDVQRLREVLRKKLGKG